MTRIKEIILPLPFLNRCHFVGIGGGGWIGGIVVNVLLFLFVAACLLLFIPKFSRNRRVCFFFTVIPNINWRILEELILPNEEMAKIEKEKLLEKGFQFKYITHMYKNKKGTTYFFAMNMDIFH